MKSRTHTPRLFLVLATLSLGVSAVSTDLTSQALPAFASVAPSIEFVGRANSGVGNAGSEIAAYDPASRRLFVTNGQTNQIDIFNIANPASPSIVRSVDLGVLGVTGIQSVASKNGVIAVASSVGGNNQAPGKIFVMDSNGTIDRRASSGVVVGSLPDSVHFTPDGRFILSANEGEPRDYCLTDGVLPTTTDPNGSVSIIDVTQSTLTATTLDFSGFNTKADAIRSAGGRVYGPGASVAQDLEPEYIGISPDSKSAFVTLQENNSVAEIDLETKKIVRVMGLGYKDHSQTGKAIDPSDRDSATNGGINIQNWPVKGMYQPDAIASFTDEFGNLYFATANEGDAREYKCLLGGTSSGSAQAEDERVAAIGVDGVSIPSTVTDNARLGRLGVTRFAPTTYTNGGNEKTAATSTDFTSLYTLGARSMSIWKSAGGTLDVSTAEQVSDTGDFIEKKIAELFPNYFNADWNTATGQINAKDTRSDNKGPEPEGLVIGKAYGRTLAFVGLERVGGIMVFDVTNPALPTYVSYINTSVFTGVGGLNLTKTGAPAGDVSPEGLLFVKASDSPIGVPLVIAAHELSGTTAIYKIVGTPSIPAAPHSVTATRSGSNAVISWQSPEDDGGNPITAYTVRSQPGGKKCTTTKTTCVIRNLERGQTYTFTVSARNGVAAGAASITSDEIKRPLFNASVGRQIKVTKKPSIQHSTDVAVAVSGRLVSVGVLTPVSTPKTSQVMRYAIQLWGTDGTLQATAKLLTNEGKALTTTLRAPKAGRYKVVVTAGLRNGKKMVWNSDSINIS